MTVLDDLVAKSDPIQEREFLPADVLYAASADFIDLICALLTHRGKLLGAAKALDDLHDRVCGCDAPGQVSLCSFEEFAALVPLREP